MKSHITEEYKKYLLSPEWRKFRKKALAHYEAKCNKCGTTTNLQVHHKTYINIFHEELEDVMILCKTHHDEIHNIKPKKVKVKKEKKLSKKRLKKLRKIERNKLRLANKRDKLSSPPPPKKKRIKPSLPSPNDVLQRKYDRISRQMRVVE